MLCYFNNAYNIRYLTVTQLAMGGLELGNMKGITLNEHRDRNE